MCLPIFFLPILILLHHSEMLAHNEIRTGFLCLNPLVPTSKPSLDLKSDNNYYFNLVYFVLTSRNNILKYDNNPDNFRVFKNWWHGCNSQPKLVWLLGKCNFSFVSSSRKTVVLSSCPFFLYYFWTERIFWQVFPRLREVVMAFIYIFG